ncbi:MAG: bifunctional folylpolyglutamate synthase/dihydrofolate synthase [Maricaulaceae bacterium]
MDTVLARIAALHPREIDLSLDRVARLLDALGRPQDRLPPVIHVAGTNGKGSVIAFLAAMARAQGLRAHVFTSPHLVTFNERITLAGAPVTDAELADLAARCETANAGAPITVFEFITAMGFLAFAEHEADLALVEVGLGGRADATNVLPAPEVTVITSIGRDHERFLGADLAGIAGEKAGILKSHVPAVFGPQPPEAEPALRQAAHRVGAPYQAYGEHFHARLEGGRLVVERDDRLLDLPPPGLIGPHQVGNAATAVVAALALGRVSDAAIADGVRSARWPGRFHPLPPGPLTALAGENADVWVDGAHNPDGARALATALAELDARDPRLLAMVMAVSTGKDVDGLIAPFVGLTRTIVGFPLDTKDRGVAPDDIAARARQAGVADTAGANSLEDAVARARAGVGPGPVRLMICGSLYGVGAALARNTAPKA